MWHSKGTLNQNITINYLYVLIKQKLSKKKLTRRVFEYVLLQIKTQEVTEELF